jgi:hypothetical protein
MRTKTILDFRGKYSKLLLFALGAFLTLAAGILDVLMGNPIFIAFLYLLPIMLTGWFVGRISVAFISSLCGIAWLATDVASGHIYSHVATTIWETFMVLCLFLIIGYSIAAMKMILHEHEPTQ